MKITIKDKSFNALAVLDGLTETKIFMSKSADVEPLMNLFVGDITINVKDSTEEYVVADKYTGCSCTETTGEKYITACKEKKPTTTDENDLIEQITNIELAICEIYESLEV